VVVLDQSVTSSRRTRRVLELLGCEDVVVVHEVVALHDALLSAHRDLLVSTWGIPGHTGQALLWLVRATDEKLPVLITTVVTSEVLHDADRAGVNAFVPQPLSPETLDVLLTVFLGERAVEKRPPIALAAQTG
jgi:DNA-binding NarL/FixJ family response regulator